NGVWSYGYENNLGSGFNLYDTGLVIQGSEGIDAAPGEEVRYSSQVGSLPSVLSNPTSSDMLLPDGTVVVPPHGLSFHPGPQGQFRVIRWTAPTEGIFNLDVAFRGDDFVFPTTTDVHVLFNGNSLFSADVLAYGPGPSFYDILTVKPGFTIDFAVGFGPDGDYK